MIKSHLLYRLSYGRKTENLSVYLILYSLDTKSQAGKKKKMQESSQHTRKMRSRFPSYKEQRERFLHDITPTEKTIGFVLPAKGSSGVMAEISTLCILVVVGVI